jgi:hypothetical protein
VRTTFDRIYRERQNPDLRDAEFRALRAKELTASKDSAAMIRAGSANPVAL